MPLPQEKDGGEEAVEEAAQQRGKGKKGADAEAEAFSMHGTGSEYFNESNKLGLEWLASEPFCLNRLQEPR